MAVTAAALVAAAIGVLPAEAAGTPVATTVKVTVNGASRPLNNPAWYQNQVALLPAGNLASVHELQPRVTRLWLSPDAVLNGGWEKNYPTYDQAAAYSGRIMINMVPCYGLFDAGRDPADCLARMEDGLRTYKQRYPSLEYVEIFNELDLTMADAAEYYTWYRRGYEIVNRINAELQPAVPIKVGGPSASGFAYCPATGTGWLRDFLAAYASDTAPAKRLDFLSYHSYNLAQKELDACGKAVYPPAAAQQKSQISALLGSLGLPTTLPVYVTELGLFAGEKTGTGTDGSANTKAKDQLVQAAGMAALDTQYTLGGIDAPYHWVFNHSDPGDTDDSQDRKSMFVDDVDGAVLPYYNVVRMQTMLKANLLTGTTVSTELDNGRGINVLATSDETGMAALVTNYQAFDRTVEHTVTFDPGTLPWTGRTVRMDRYLVNETTSNYNYNPAAASLQKVESVTLAPGATAAKRVLSLKPNAVTLFVYTPLPLQYETEDLPTTATGGVATDIEDADASGGKLNKFAGTGVAGQVAYTIAVPAAGTYDLALRVKKTPDRGIVRVTLDGTTAGTVDAGSTGYAYETVSLGSRTLTAGNHTVAFTLTGTSTGGWTVGFDYLTLD